MRFQLDWEAATPAGTAADATWGRLELAVGDAVIWGACVDGEDRGVSWTWIELLEHLAEVWPWLRFEDGWPHGCEPANPAHFDALVAELLDSMPAGEREEVERALFEFRVTHDLSAGLHGAVLPPCWIVREGDTVAVGGNRWARVAADPAFEALAALGTEIADRVRTLDDERAAEALRAWEHREDVEPRLLIEIVTAADGPSLTELADADQLLEDFELDPAHPRPSELMAAARMAFPVAAPSTVRQILAVLRAVGRSETATLDELSKQARAMLLELPSDSRAADQGYALGAWIRRQLGVADTQPVDVRAVLEQWGVHVEERAIPDPNIEAVACWGDRHGPAIVVNEKGKHSRNHRGRNATLAHEMAHLLVDRAAGLPLAEVLGGRVRVHLERRAKAFAAELLIPRAVAGARMAADGRQALERLARRYQASHELIAWQARNSETPLPSEIRVFLRSKVSMPQRF